MTTNRAGAMSRCVTSPLSDSNAGAADEPDYGTWYR
jgi:hypothetical protein